jgi:hypothetical protein
VIALEFVSRRWMFLGKKMMFPVVDVSPFYSFFFLSSVNIDVRKVIEKFPNWGIYINRSQKQFPPFIDCALPGVQFIIISIQYVWCKIFVIFRKGRRRLFWSTEIDWQDEKVHCQQIVDVSAEIDTKIKRVSCSFENG